MSLDERAGYSQAGRPSGLVGWAVGLYLRWRNADLNAAAVDALVPFPGDRVLEIGFGPGEALRRLSAVREIGKITGIDHSATMLALADQRNQPAVASGAMELHLASIDAAPFAERSFDAILAIDCVQYWPDLIADLAVVRRLLRPGGRALFALRGDEVQADGLSPAKLRQALAAAGFVHITTERAQTRPAPSTLLLARRQV
ncbi:MAG TPA: class I SAM-dependent methyltransferase [Aliidongia sp.]|uniref:class I SAM-dependent methyltransferase n=1 Tax=Aliidongia sp. TaxID=1914230 RepID=UPI002DDD2B9B|nr:class I SAM-dependent methyltransferase [Aliidongia sp.]HEV2674880.1 class I SAM-dependent methyltransferase [Aliidongia sp.]